jgi:predicted O-methyltransferase YrrM
MTDEDWNAARLVRVSGAYWEAFALHAGVSLDVFTILGEEPADAAALSQKVGADKRGLEALLNALTAMGLLQKANGKFMNTGASSSFLVSTSPSYMGDIIRHHHYLVSSWSKLSAAVRKGTPVRRKKRTKDEIGSFLLGMTNQALRIAPRVANEIDLYNRRHLLDLGGGPGTYAVHFCLANTDMKATIFDLPDTRPFALQVIEKAGLRDRVDFLGGDYLKDDIGGPYDVVWLSHVLHSMGPEECLLVIEKAVSALESDGLILVHDFLLSDTRDGPLFPALFALNMLVNTPQGRSYSDKEVTEMLSRVGVKEVIRLPFRDPTDSGILCGRV